MLIKIPRKDTTTVVAALAKHISKLPEELRRSLTWDQGKEMHAHKRFTVATNVQVYFCDPRSPWQRGSNENTNGLLRQYLPRRTEFSRISQSYLNAIALRLNQRPRKTWASKRRPIDCKRCCTDRLNAHRELGHSRQIIKPVVTTAAGGAKGGGTIVTPVGEKIIELYHSIETHTRAAARSEFRAFRKLTRG